MKSKSITGKERLLEWQSVAYTYLKLDLNIDMGVRQLQQNTCRMHTRVVSTCESQSVVVPLNMRMQSLTNTAIWCNQTRSEYQDFARKRGGRWMLGNPSASEWVRSDNGIWYVAGICLVLRERQRGRQGEPPYTHPVKYWPVSPFELV